MRVYHFIDSKFGLLNIKDRHLKISELSNLNDPFEFFSVRMENKDLRSALKSTKKDLGKKYGIICFSKDWTNPVQWAHYAENHKGLCLGFDIPDRLLCRVNYIQERLEVPYNFDEAFMLKLLSTKFTHWAYEKEYRTFLSLEKKVGNFYFKDFDSDLNLKQVIVGCESFIERRQLNEVLGDVVNTVEVFKARPAFKNFTLTEQKNKALW